MHQKYIIEGAIPEEGDIRLVPRATYDMLENRIGIMAGKIHHQNGQLRLAIEDKRKTTRALYVCFGFLATSVLTLGLAGGYILGSHLNGPAKTQPPLFLEKLQSNQITPEEPLSDLLTAQGG